MRGCARTGRFRAASFAKLAEGKDGAGDDADWQLDELKEVDERLSTFIKDSGAPPFEGADFVMKYEDEKAAEMAGTEGPELTEDPFN